MPKSTSKTALIAPQATTTTSRSTRARIRSESNSLSQSLPKRTRTTRSKPVEELILPVRVRPGGKAETQESTASSASLPGEFEVRLACAPGTGSLGVEEAGKVWTAGAEILSDGWKRDDKAGKLEDLRKVVKAGRYVGHGEKTSGKVADVKRKLGKDVLWYTAKLTFPRTGDLTVHKYAWTPRISPPTGLPQLEFQPAHLVPRVGASIPTWNIDPVVDIDPLSDDFIDFEPSWRDATGSGWGEMPAQIDGGNDGWSLDCDEVEEGQTIVDTSASLYKTKGDLSRSELGAASVTDQGLNTRLVARAQRGSSRTDVDGGREDDEESMPLFDLPPRIPLTEHHVEPEPAAKTIDWQFEAKQRKGWWKAETAKEGYAEVWSIIPWPHQLSVRTRLPGQPKSKSPRPPNYILPRFYTLSTSTHPFHPDLSSHLASQPYCRVHWIIPIQGPVHIPTYSDYLVKPPPKAPTPSPARLVSTSTSDTSPARTITWTPDLLRHFWKDFLIPLHADTALPFGPISIVVSGPKPDPQIALVPPAPLLPWLTDLSSRPGQNHRSPSTKMSVPVRPEMGDHLRIYCYLKHALSLRTWLHAIEVDSAYTINTDQDAPVTGQTPIGVEEGRGQGERVDGLGKVVKLFDKVRLTLVGDRGEALIVA